MIAVSAVRARDERQGKPTWAKLSQGIGLEPAIPAAYEAPCLAAAEVHTEWSLGLPAARMTDQLFIQHVTLLMLYASCATMSSWLRVGYAITMSTLKHCTELSVCRSLSRRCWAKVWP